MQEQYIIEDKYFLDLSPIDIGIENCLPGKTFGPYVRNYYLIHFIVDGEGVFVNPRGEHHVKKGSAFLIRPSENCMYTADAINPWSYVWIGFVGALSKKFDSVEDLFEFDSSIVDEIILSTKLDAGREEYLAGILFKLCSFLFGGRVKSDYINMVKNYINSNYMNDVKIAAIADKLNVNRKYLARIFKARTGKTMQDYLIGKRLTEAKKLLESGYNVEESSLMVGYNDAFTFSKAFKKVYGRAPSDFKLQPGKNTD